MDKFIVRKRKRSPETNQREDPLTPLRQNASNSLLISTEQCSTPTSSTSSAVHMQHTNIIKQIQDASVLAEQTLQGRQLTFQTSWFQKFGWLHTCPVEKAAFCFVCRSASDIGMKNMCGNYEECFITTGFRNWKKALQRFRSHETSAAHRTASMILAQQKAAPVNAQISQHYAAEQKNAQACLLAIITSIQYLARQGIALRGHEDIDSNFMQLLLLRKNDLPILQGWLQRHKDYTSPLIQNEILEILAHVVIRQIAKRVAAEPFFAVMVDGTIDSAGLEQESVCVRIVDEDLQPVELFLGLYDMSAGTSGTSLARMIKDVFCRLCLQLSKVRGQCYDGAGNMAGKYSGAQAEIKKENPRALFVHCSAHCVNLVTQSTVSASIVVDDAVAHTHEIGSFMSKSLKLRNFMGSLQQESGPNSGNPVALRPLCPTRWTIRGQNITQLLTNYSLVRTALENLAYSPTASSSSTSRARGLSEKMHKGSTIAGLVMGKHIFLLLENLCKTAESPAVTMSGILQCVQMVKEEITRRRSEIEFKKMWTTIMELCVSLSVDEPKTPPLRRPPARFISGSSAHQYSTAEDYYRREYFAILDAASTHLEERFNQLDHRMYSQLEETLIQGDGKSLDDPNISTEKLAIQLPMFRSQGEVTSLQSAVALMSAMKPEVRLLFTEVELLIRRMLVLPCSNATAERSFSGLRRLKTWLRCTMTQERINHVAILNVHQSLVDSISPQEILQEFVQRNNFRRNVFGHC